MEIQFIVNCILNFFLGQLGVYKAVPRKLSLIRYSRSHGEINIVITTSKFDGAPILGEELFKILSVWVKYSRDILN